MKLKVTIDLTREEILKAVTAWVRNEVKYRSNFPDRYGDAIEFEIDNQGQDFHVQWGELPVRVSDEPDTLTPQQQATVDAQEIGAALAGGARTLEECK